MTVPWWLEQAFYWISDFLYERRSQPLPTQENLRKARLIAHRGACDDRSMVENTLAAFDRALHHGVWGIEFDVQWTKDLVPVVFHDSDCRRLFESNIVIGEYSLKALKSKIEIIPTLAEVIEKYGGSLHLMVEIKNSFTDPDQQNAVLLELFSNLTPVKDFHLMTSTPPYFQSVTFAPPVACIPIAEININTISHMVIQNGYGGMAGHYLLLYNRLIKKLSSHNISVGTGFINSKYCLFRELNRGVTWLFSDRAAEIQEYLNRQCR